MAYRHLLQAQVRSQAQYRASLAVDVAGSVLFGVLDIVSVVVLFRVGVLSDAGVDRPPRPVRRAGVPRLCRAGHSDHGGGRRRTRVADRRSALSEHRLVTVIEARGLRKEFTVRVKSGWLRRRTRVVAAVDGIALTVERGRWWAISARTAQASRRP